MGSSIGHPSNGLSARSQGEIACSRREHSQYEEGLELIGEFLKGVFVAGLRDQRIKVIVKTKGEEGTIAQLIETAIQEECELRSQKYKVNAGPVVFWHQRGTKQERQGSQVPPVKREINTVTVVKCFGYGKPGHLIKECRTSARCPICGRKGHSEWDCRKQGNRRQESRSSQALPAARTAE
jgi:hypothetical protein